MHSSGPRCPSTESSYLEVPYCIPLVNILCERESQLDVFLASERSDEKQIPMGPQTLFLIFNGLKELDQASLTLTVPLEMSGA